MLDESPRRHIVVRTPCPLEACMRAKLRLACLLAALVVTAMGGCDMQCYSKTDSPKSDGDTEVKVKIKETDKR
jgi:hypothetical protein